MPWETFPTPQSITLDFLIIHIVGIWLKKVYISTGKLIVKITVKNKYDFDNLTKEQEDNFKLLGFFFYLVLVILIVYIAGC